MSVIGWKVAQTNFGPNIIVDTFFMFEHKDHVEKFLRYINSRHRNIQFTCEE